MLRIFPSFPVTAHDAKTRKVECYALQGYLAHKKQRLPRTLQKNYAHGHMEVLGGRAVSYERGAPVRVYALRFTPYFHASGFPFLPGQAPRCQDLQG